MTDNDELVICQDCVKDNRYKILIKHLKTNGLCSCCNKSKYVIEIDSNEFIQMTKALIRYHFSEFDYNEDFGGDSYVSLFYNDDNIFLNKANFTDEILYEELLNRIECFEVYEEYDKGVSLYAGEFDGYPISPFRSIKTDFDSSIKQIESRLKVENYFNFEDETIQHLSSYKEICKLIIKKGEPFYRSRIGYEDKKKSMIEGGYEGKIIYVPYSNSQISAPPPFLSGFGRINRVGVSYLYCATDKYTAISEIRPHPGDIVSIGKFISNRQLFIFDLTERQFLNFYSTDANLKNFKKLNTFTELMQKVIPPSERQAYNITQLIADCIRKLNFDGILFPSSVGKGDNLVVFNPFVLNYTYDEAEVVEVQEVNYMYHSCEWKKDIAEIE